jgi:hypothetical protein
MTYEDFCNPYDVMAFKRVKASQQILADKARSLIVQWYPDAFVTSRGKQFVHMPDGTSWRVKINSRSDNSTEEIAHKQMGVRHEVNVLDLDDLASFIQRYSPVSAFTAGNMAVSFASCLKVLMGQ